MLLQRQQKLCLYGDGSPTRRYLYAGDIVDALDTILHKGAIGQIYNIASKDEISNTEICHRLLDIFGLPHGTPAELDKLIQYTEDRPFTDQRYATDGSKLTALGWQPKKAFDEGLRETVAWYRRFGEAWWGDISRVLTSFPVVAGTEIWTKEEHDDLSSSDGELVADDNSKMWTQHAKKRLQELTGAE
jgi:dTDP-glucose 4,6-dehydratase